MFEHNYPHADGVSDRLAIAIRHIEFARKYSMSLLEDLNDEDWFWSPDQYTTHLAWQAGHLAMSQYGLTLFQQRGRDFAIDKALMSSKFRKLFMRGTTPVADRDAYPEPVEILATLDRVHEQMQKEIVTFDGEQLDEPLGPPHAAFATRYGALLFAGDHEMIHSGQMGMLRRLMGKLPLR